MRLIIYLLSEIHVNLLWDPRVFVQFLQYFLEHIVIVDGIIGINF